MAPTPPPLEQDHQEPRRRRSAAASTAASHVGFGLSARPADDQQPQSGGAPSIALTGASIRIEDGLLMAFGPEGDPLPPATFVALAAEQPDAGVQRVDGGTVPALQVAQVLEAQAKGPLGAGQDDAAGAAAWIEAMLGWGPRPVAAAEAELTGEERACELTVFSHELMLAIPGGRSFLIAEAAAALPAAALGLVLADGQCLSVDDLVARLRAHAEPRPRTDAANAGAVQPLAEVVLPGCAVQRSRDGVVLELPALGTLRLASLASDTPAGPRVSLALADGQPASLAELVAALGEPGAGPARSERLALPAPDRDRPLPGPAAPGRPIPVTFKTPNVKGVDPDWVAIVIIDGVPPGGVLSAGIDDGGGRWLVSPRHLTRLTLAPPAGSTGNLALNVTAVAVGNRAGDFTTASEGVVLALDPPAEGALPLALDPALLQDGGPALSAVMIRGIPPGARLSAGTYDAATDGWVLRPDQLEGLTITAPAGEVGCALTVLGISLAAGGRAEARVLTRLTLPRP